MRFLNGFKICRQFQSLHIFQYDAVKHFNFHIPNLFKVDSSGFHFSTHLNAKSFQEKENEYAHRVMESIPAYFEYVLKPPLGIEGRSQLPNELKKFEKVTKHCISQNISLEDNRFSSLVSDIIRIIPQLSNENIIRCLHLLCCWPPTPKSWTPNFKVLWNSIDSECVDRLQSWDTHLKLLVADYWFHLRLNRISQYNRRMIINLLENLNHLTDTEMVQLMFFINLQREVPSNFLGVLESRLLSVVKTISIEEVGIIGLGFFKTKNKITDISIIMAVIDRLVNEIESAKLVSIVALLKFLKKSMQLSYTESYIPLLHRCVPCIAKWDIKTSIHLALLSSECHVYHPLLLNAVTEKVTREIETALIKDCMKLLQCLSHFNHPPSATFNDLLILEIHKECRKSEISNYPRDLIYSALYYAYLAHFNYDLLKIVLNPNFVQRCITMFPETSLAFSEVDCCVEIECKDYDGPRLDRSKWSILERRRGNVISSSSNTLTRLTSQVVQSLEELLGNKECILVKHILPHIFSPDIIVQLSGNAITNDSRESICLPPQNEIWACLVLGVPFSFAYRSKNITGVMAMKLRQLARIGYKPIFIPYYELPYDSVERKKFLKNKLDILDKC